MRVNYYNLLSCRTLIFAKLHTLWAAGPVWSHPVSQTLLFLFIELVVASLATMIMRIKMSRMCCGGCRQQVPEGGVDYKPECGT